MPFSADRADRMQRFCERLLRHTKGKWAGVPFTLEPWQRDEIIRPLFGTLNKDGTRQFRTAYVEIPRKNGKSEIAAAVALYLLFADREQGAEIYGAAKDKEQAGIVFRVAAQMVRQSPSLSKRAKIIDSQKRIIAPETGSFYWAIPADAAGSQGYNASGIIFDELHTQPNRELWDVLTTSTGAREQPLTFAITTAGFDTRSICWEQHEYAERVGNRIVDDPTFFGYIRSAPDDADWTDEQVWRAANPALGAFRNLDEMRAVCKKAQETPDLQNTFRRLYLCQWTQQETRWLDLAAWDASAGLVVEEDLAGRECYAGLDLSSTTDLSAFTLVFPPTEEDPQYAVVSRFFLPEEGLRDRGLKDRVPYETWKRQGFLRTTPGNVIDYAAIEAEIGALGQRFDIREIAFDRWGATQISQDLTAAGFTMVPFGQGYASMSAPTKELQKLVLSGRLRHGGHPVLRWNADNAAVETDAAANIKLTKAKARGRIDGLVATVMGLDRAIRHEAEDGSVYETRGIIDL